MYLICRKNLCVQDSDLLDRDIELSSSNNLFRGLEWSPSVTEFNLEEVINEPVHDSHYTRVIN